MAAINRMNDQRNWHWERGITFALEGVKSILVLNGAASVSLLTFLGHQENRSGWLIAALISFSVGAASAAPTMIFAYLTQLHYGNAIDTDATNVEVWSTATKLHYVAYGFMALGIICFLAGMVLGACGLTHAPAVLPPAHRPLMQRLLSPTEEKRALVPEHRCSIV